MTLGRRFWRDLPLGSRIAALASILIVLTVLTVTLLNIQAERSNFRRELEAQASLVLSTLSERLLDPLYASQVDELHEVAQNITAHQQFTRFKVYDKVGTLLIDANQPEVDFPPDPNPIDPKLLALAPDAVDFAWGQHELIATETLWIAVYPIGAVQMGFSTRPLDQRIAGLTTRSITLAVAALAISILLATLTARQLTYPIRELTKTAGRMAGGDLSTRFTTQGTDEIGKLGRAFNEMATAIEKRETDLRNQARGLEKAVNQRTFELQQQNQYLAALHEVTRGLIENLDVDWLLEAIVTRAAQLARTDHAFVSVVDAPRGKMQLRVAKGNYRSQLGLWTEMHAGLSGRVVASGEMQIEEDYQRLGQKLPGFEWLRTGIYVPLRSETGTLGVIGLGYDHIVPVEPDSVAILNQFAVLASLALKNAQLYDEARQELAERTRIETIMADYEDRLEVTVEERTQQLTESNRKLQAEIAERERTQAALRAEEQRVEAYRNSPQGRADAVREKLLQDPAQALIALHDLAQQTQTEETAAVFSRLPGVLQAAGHAVLARLAEGYDYVHRSQAEPELMAVGLRHLLAGLAMPEAAALQHASEAASLYALAQQAMDVTSIPAITSLLPALQSLQAPPDAAAPFFDLTTALRGLVAAAQSLHAYERVDTTDDRGAYLVNAVERLSHADRFAESLRAADGPIARGITEDWLAIVTGSMTDLQTRAQISLRLLTRHTWDQDIVTLALRLRNDGQGIALNLRLRLEECPDYDAADEGTVIDRLATGEENQVELRVRPRSSLSRTHLRAHFALLYDDPRGPDQVEHFADRVQLLGPAPAFQLIPNPYVAGTPLEAGSPLFFGRQDVFNFIGENLEAAHRNNLVLIGQRRTGKSSLLKQLPLNLGDEYVPVYLDGQSIALEPGLSSLFLNIATEIGLVLKDRGFPFTPLPPRKFTDRPAHTFEYEFLPRVRTAIGKRALVLLLDEFEELESAVKNGHLDASVFGFLRHLIQHEHGLSVIFCGTHRMEELATDYWSVLFNISLYKHVGFLEYDEATRLIQEPVAAFGMRYDDLALDKIWRITAGHPYFLQLLCHSLVNQHNRSGRSYVTISDVNDALDDILSSGEAHFVYLWNESNPTERQVLTALSRMMALVGHVTAVQVQDFVAEHGLSLERRLISDTLHHLAMRDILAMQADNLPAGMGGTYSWRLGLLGLWIERYKSLSLVQEEVRP